MKILANIGVLWVAFYAAMTYILHQKGWMLYQALLGALPFTLVCAGILTVPLIILIGLIKKMRNENK